MTCQRPWDRAAAGRNLPATILSLNASNKLQKHYLAGIYGQGGSSTFAVCKYTLIASRNDEHPLVGFTLVRFLDLPPEDYKTGHYVYLIHRSGVLQVELPIQQFENGTQVKHFGFDLSNYPSPVGPNSLYGLLNRILFDPVLPVWLDSRLHNYRRVIKGSRNALNGAVDEGDEERRGPPLSHHVPIFYVSLGDFGRIGIEYWVLERPSKENKNPIAAFVHPSKPIVLTLQGQNHAELSRSLIKSEVQLPFLTQRLICHIDCNSLTPTAKRVLFVSSREDARRGIVYNLIQQELVKALKSDDELVRLNNEAKELASKKGTKLPSNKCAARLHGYCGFMVLTSPKRSVAQHRAAKSGRSRLGRRGLRDHNPYRSKSTIRLPTSVSFGMRMNPSRFTKTRGDIFASKRTPTAVTTPRTIPLHPAST